MVALLNKQQMRHLCGAEPDRTKEFNYYQRSQEREVYKGRAVDAQGFNLSGTCRALVQKCRLANNCKDDQDHIFHIPRGVGQSVRLLIAPDICS
jgi:hypothetical protein